MSKKANITINRDLVREYQRAAKKALDAGARCEKREDSDRDLTGFRIDLSAAGTITFRMRVSLPDGTRPTRTLGTVQGGMTAEQARLDAERYRDTTPAKGDTKATLERKAALLHDLLHGDDDEITLERYIDTEFAGRYRNEKKTVASRERSVLDIKRVFPEFMPMRLKDITGTMLIKWRTARVSTMNPRTGTYIAPSTANRELNNLNAVFSMALQDEVISAHPMAKIEKGERKLDERERARTLYLKPDEEYRLREVLDAREQANRQHYAARANDPRYGFIFPKSASFTDYMKPLILITLNTGMRLKEALTLKWSQVSFELEKGNGEITVNALGNKGVITRRVPLTAEAAEVFKAWRDQCRALPVPSMYVFPDDLGQARTRYNAQALRTLFAEAGLHGYTYRDLRRSFATHACMHDIPVQLVQQFMGHTNIKTTLGYVVNLNEHDHIAKLDRKQTAVTGYERAKSAA